MIIALFRSKGVRLVMRNPLARAIFNLLGTLLYNANIDEQEQWQPG